MPAAKKRDKLIFTAVPILMGIAVLVSIVVGKYPISLNDMWNLLRGRPVPDMVRSVFFTLRLPRTVMVLVAGVGLSMAGSVYQTIFKNPLASPDIIGVSSGASLGAAFAILFLGGGTVAVALGAFGGGLLAVALVLGLVGIASTPRNSTATFVLAGIVINALAQAGIMTLKYMADPERQLATIDFWMMGSFGNVTATKTSIVLPIFLVGLTGLCLLRWQVSLLSLSDDEGRMLGVRVRAVRALVLVFATLVVASVVCITGLITFIGLLAPHIARLLLRRNSFSTTLLSGMVGATLLLAADCLARSVAGGELPISILTSVLGAPFLAYFMYRGKRLP